MSFDVSAVGVRADEVQPENPVSETAVVTVAPAEPRNDDTQPAQRLIRLTKRAELFHTPGGDMYASVPVKAHRETYPIAGARFEQWLRHELYLTTHTTPTDHALHLS